MRMVVVSSKTAEKRNSPIRARNWNKPKSYVAILERGLRDSIERRFVRRVGLQTETEIVYSLQTTPGEIYEIRRWCWSPGHECFLGGVVWIGIAEAGPMALTREEAFASVLARKIEGEMPDMERPVRVLPTRVLPAGVSFS